MTDKNNKFLLRRMLFLELTGIFSLLLSVAAVFLLFSLSTVQTNTIVLLAAGFVIMFTFVVLSIRYARRDIHKIHILHSNALYKFGRLFIYAIGLAMIGYSFYLILTQKDFFTSVATIVESVIVLVLGIWVVYYTYLIHYLIENEHLRHNHATFGDYFWVVILPVILTGSSVYYLVNQKAENVSTGKADFEISAGKLIAEFENNDSIARLKYVGKSVKFSSIVLETAGDSGLLLKLNASVEGYTVNCGFDKSLQKNISSIKPTDSIEIQCSCSGLMVPDDGMSLLSDKSLEMTRCNVLKVFPNKQ